MHVHGERKKNAIFTLCLKASLSSGVNESDLAMTGTTLTTSESFLSTTISIGFKLKKKSKEKKSQLVIYTPFFLSFSCSFTYA
jgi:hypothetical protein